MKRTFAGIFGLLVILGVVVVSQGISHGQGPGGLSVAEGKICSDVVDRECLNANTRFAVPPDRLFCFTRIVGAENPTSVTHVWYYGDKERARVNLKVGSSNWRTYSSKRIQAHEIGEWHVDVLGPEGRLLMVIPFEIH
ncbi:MAG: DUF2914 domain-containing protein [Deltaproteobacteria bacterium]|nr:DUF2914 domain-containing protein [Deltaproteobacteria bacterium]MBW2136838.1 DUF2914 domain-containing protein [Deltaproteobacteria bacterium]